jgi:nicotinamide-nucleotide amidase
MATAAILSVGDELSLGQSLDTHAQWLSQRLVELGVVPILHATVGDDEQGLVDALAAAMRRADVIVITGGLGPTADDLTREALAALAGPGLVHDPEAEVALRARFEARGRRLPESNLKQALRPSWMRMIPNPLGTAPGLVGTLDGVLVASLPGPPDEMHPMWRDHVAAAVRAHVGQAPVRCETVLACGLPESVAAERLGAVMDRGRNPMVGITVSGTTLAARIRAVGDACGDGSVEATIDAVHKAWGPLCFGRETDTLAGSIGQLLVAQGASVATCESCTGGGVARALTAVSGSSAWFGAGWITYANEAKVRLGVDATLIDRHGAVSAEVAHAMATAAARVAGARFGVATTGVAGPTGGSDSKPVGTVWIHVHDEQASLRPRRFLITGDRTMVRERATALALVLLRLAILGCDERSLLWEVG